MLSTYAVHAAQIAAVIVFWAQHHVATDASSTIYSVTQTEKMLAGQVLYGA